MSWELLRGATIGAFSHVGGDEGIARVGDRLRLAQAEATGEKGTSIEMRTENEEATERPLVDTELTRCQVGWGTGSGSVRWLNDSKGQYPWNRT